MLKRTMSLMLVLLLTMSSVAGLASASTTTKETVIKLSDTAVTVDGKVASTSSSAAVYTGASIVYYEPYSSTEDTKGVVDLSNAGAQVILADGSVNIVNGAYVAKIYKKGTTKKLHKYDGAFYSKMSMNISGEAKGTGELHITATNEGLDTELHLALNGGKVYIESQDDGINTNEDGISVTSINGGYLYVNAGLGAEGDGIDSNGYLTINGGTIVTMANDRNPDGGIDADSDIIINGGTVIALGTRNDASSSTSKQPFIELSFATTQIVGSVIKLTDAEGNELLNHTAEKNFQSVTFSSADLKLDTEYHLYINGVQQQYTGNSFGMMGGNPPSGERPEMPEGKPPEILDGTQGTPSSKPEGTPPEKPSGTPADKPEGGINPGGQQDTTVSGEGSTAYVITASVHSFSGISEVADNSGKTKVTFTVNDGAGIQSVASGESIVFNGVKASADVPESDIQLTVTDVPSENYSQTYLLSELKGDLSQIMPEDDGQYRLTIAVVSSNDTYTGVSQWQFAIGVLPFTDVNTNDAAYTAIEALYEKGIMIGTSSFNDVVKNSWYSGYVGWAVENGIVIGDEKGNFMPNANVTAEQMKLVISRYAEVSGFNISVDDLFPSTLTCTMTRAELATLLSKLL